MNGKTPLNTPILISKGVPTDTPGSPGNPCKHTQFRSLIFIPITGATGYNVHAYASRDDAVSNANAVAIAKNVAPTIESTSTGGTMKQVPMELTDDEVLIDVRLIQFENTPGSDVTRELPGGYTPAGLGDTYYPGDGSGDKTNLKPGQYWFRLQAVDVSGNAVDSELSAIYSDGDALTIAMGPDETRDRLNEILRTKGKPGTTPDSTFRIVDLRSFPEFGDEGYIRFSERTEIVEFNTTQKAEAIFGHVDDKSAVTIFVFCRGGGRAVTAARNLANAGYTNSYDVQGVIQWTHGLMYDDGEFRFRQVPTSAVEKLDNDVDGALAEPTDEDSPTGITYDTTNKSLRWYNIPRAKYYIYAFDTATENDTSKAVAKATMEALAPDLTGTGADWRFVRKFDINTLNLGAGEYYLRVQAAPEVDEPVSGYSPAVIWGEPSKHSDPVKTVIGA